MVAVNARAGIVLPDSILNCLPQNNGFLRTYAEYVSACSDAPPVYHVGVGLTILSTLVGDDLRCPWTAGNTLKPNLYTLLIGPSRRTRKTTSVDAGINMLGIADPSLVIPTPGSYEELISQLRRKSVGVLVLREFAHFLKATQRGYAEQQRTALMDLYDWPDERPFTRNLKKGETRIEGPICLSLLGGVSTDTLFQLTDWSDWLGGFYGRMLFLHSDGEDAFRMPGDVAGYRNHLIGYMRGYGGFRVPKCAGFHHAGWEWFAQWAEAKSRQADVSEGRERNFLYGCQEFAAKIALLYAIDAHECVQPGWFVSPESVYRAVTFIEHAYLPSCKKLGEKVQFSEWERHRQRLIDMLARSGETGLTEREILRRTKLSMQDFQGLMDTLRGSDLIEQVGTTTTNARHRMKQLHRSSARLVPPAVIRSDNADETKFSS